MWVETATLMFAPEISPMHQSLTTTGLRQWDKAPTLTVYNYKYRSQFCENKQLSLDVPILKHNTGSGIDSSEINKLVQRSLRPKTISPQCLNRLGQ